MSVKKCYSNCHETAAGLYPVLCTQLIKLTNPDYIKSASDFATLTHHSGASLRRSDILICKGCLRHVSNLTGVNFYKFQEVEAECTIKASKRHANPEPVPTPHLKRSTKGIPVHDLVHAIRFQDFTTEELELLSSELGKKVANSVRESVKSLVLTQADHRLKDMECMTYAEHWKEFDGPLKAFLQSVMETALLTGHHANDENANRRRLRHLLKAVDSIYGAINLRFISPVALAESLYVYFHSGSRKVCDLYGLASSCGGATLLQNTLSSISQKPPPIPGDGYLIIAIDNNQVISKTYRIQLESKLPVSVVTSVAAFRVSDPNSIQNSPLTFPRYVSVPHNLQENFLNKMMDFTLSSAECVDHYLNRFLEKRLAAMIESITKDDGRTMDNDIDSKLTEIPERLGLRYSEIEKGDGACTIFDQECILVNPNSFKGVSTVLNVVNDFAKQANKKWITLVADGLPFSIAQELIRQIYCCTTCGADLKKSEAKQHFKSNHDMTVPPDLPRKYTSILLRPGAGHYEINFVKALLMAWFPLIFEPVAELMGFRSPKQKHYCASAADHHKSWQLLEIVFEAVIDELLYEYVTSAQSTNNKPTVIGFRKNLKSSENLNVLVATTFTLKFCFPIILFRAGIRQCNFIVSSAAREMASVLFFAFHHPKYQKINFYDVAELVQTPKSVRSTVYRDSLVVPKSDKGQGIDFLLEERNKVMKKYVVYNGIPTSNQWVAASRSMNLLDRIIDSVKTNIGDTEGTQNQDKDFREEKLAVRRHFRSRGCFKIDSSSNFTITAMPEVDEMVLRRFIQSHETGEENRKLFYEGMIKSGNMHLSNYVSLDPEKAPGPKTWTTPYLVLEIRKMLSCLTPDLKQAFPTGLSKLKKAELIELYYKISNYVEGLENNIVHGSN